MRLPHRGTLPTLWMTLTSLSIVFDIHVPRDASAPALPASSSYDHASGNRYVGGIIVWATQLLKNGGTAVFSDTFLPTTYSQYAAQTGTTFITIVTSTGTFQPVTYTMCVGPHGIGWNLPSLYSGAPMVLPPTVPPSYTGPQSTASSKSSGIAAGTSFGPGLSASDNPQASSVVSTIANTFVTMQTSDTGLVTALTSSAKSLPQSSPRSQISSTTRLGSLPPISISTTKPGSTSSKDSMRSGASSLAGGVPQSSSISMASGATASTSTSAASSQASGNPASAISPSAASVSAIKSNQPSPAVSTQNKASSSGISNQPSSTKAVSSPTGVSQTSTLSTRASDSNASAATGTGKKLSTTRQGSTSAVKSSHLSSPASSTTKSGTASTPVSTPRLSTSKSTTGTGVPDSVVPSSSKLRSTSSSTVVYAAITVTIVPLFAASGSSTTSVTWTSTNVRITSTSNAQVVTTTVAEWGCSGPFCNENCIVPFAHCGPHAGVAPVGFLWATAPPEPPPGPPVSPAPPSPTGAPTPNSFASQVTSQQASSTGVTSSTSTSSSSTQPFICEETCTSCSGSPTISLSSRSSKSDIARRLISKAVWSITLESRNLFFRREMPSPGSQDPAVWLRDRYGQVPPANILDNASGTMRGDSTSMLIKFEKADTWLVKGLEGCTSIIVVSSRGLWISHFWQSPSFGGNESPDVAEVKFQKNVLDFIDDGNGQTGPKLYFGIGHTEIFLAENPNDPVAQGKIGPQAITITPFKWGTSGWAFPNKVARIQNAINHILHNPVVNKVHGYTVNPEPASAGDFKYVNGKVFIQYDPAGPNSCNEITPTVRVWSETEIVLEKSWLPPPATRQKRMQPVRRGASCVASPATSQASASQASSAPLSKSGANPTASSKTKSSTQTAVSTATSAPSGGYNLHVRQFLGLETTQKAVYLIANVTNKQGVSALLNQSNAALEWGNSSIFHGQFERKPIFFLDITPRTGLASKRSLSSIMQGLWRRENHRTELIAPSNSTSSKASIPAGQRPQLMHGPLNIGTMGKAWFDATKNSNCHVSTWTSGGKDVMKSVFGVSANLMNRHIDCIGNIDLYGS